MVEIKVVALAGGVGGAKMVDGLARILPDHSLTVIVNTGDDFDHFGLRICPDLDTICYTLAGIANPETGWGRKEETWKVLEALVELGGPTWFRIGDRDLATHLERTRRLAEGITLREITQQFCDRWGVSTCVIPMTNAQVSTIVKSVEGDLAFQDYFVKRKCEPRVSGFYFKGGETAEPSPGILQAIREAKIVIICPSNPWVSIDPILAIPGIKTTLMTPLGLQRVFAISPIIAGAAVKGPAAKMYFEMGIEPSAVNVAQHYGSKRNHGLLDGFVFDSLDQDQTDEIANLGLATFKTNTLMKSVDDRIRFAREVMDFATAPLD